LIIINQNNDANAKHILSINNKDYEWKGGFYMTKNE
jgi:hypothetical protein